VTVSVTGAPLLWVFAGPAEQFFCPLGRRIEPSC